MLDERFIINERFFPELKMVDNRLVNALLLLYESDDSFSFTVLYNFLIFQFSI